MWPGFAPAVELRMDATPDDAELDFAALLQRFEMPLLRYATRIIGDVERARDVVQETFVQLQRTTRDEHDNAPAKWLFTVCRNRALNVCRKERRLAFLDEQVLEAEPATEPWPNEQLERKEARSFALRIIETLPPRQQEVLQLKFQSDLSYAEIAAITQLSVNHVGVLIHTALKTLRQRYASASRDFIAFKPHPTT